MFSRRLFRIKVMQCLYAYEQNPSATPRQLQTYLKRNVTSSENLIFIHFMYLLRLAEYAITVQKNQEKKHIKRDDNYEFYHRIDENPMFEELRTNVSFLEGVESRKIGTYSSEEMLRKLFGILKTKESFHNYITNDHPKVDDYKKVIKMMFKKVMLKSEAYMEIIEENFSTWEDDKNVIINKILGAINVFYLNFPKTSLPDFSFSDSEGRIFCEQLLIKTLNKYEELNQLITPKLKNWESDRINVVDNVLIKMALCEMLHFPSIPLKVTINEYIEISKVYSTPKSKEFINGLLDNLMKELKKNGQIVKEGRGLRE